MGSQNIPNKDFDITELIIELRDFLIQTTMLLKEEMDRQAASFLMLQVSLVSLKTGLVFRVH